MKKTYKLSKLSLSILICFLLAIATLVPTAIYAKYVKTENMAPQTAQVAEWSVTEDCTFSSSYNITIAKPGDSCELVATGKNYTTDITNKGEVAFQVTLSIQYVGELPLTTTYDDGTTTTNINTCVFNLDIGQNAKHKITISWPSAQNDYRFSGGVQIIKLTMTAVQID